MYDTRDFYVLYNRFLEEEGLPLLPDLPPEERKLAYEDVYPILYLKYRLSEAARAARISNIWWWMRCRIIPASSI